MFNQILGYLRNAYDDLDFTAWRVVTALILPNHEKSEPQKFEGHFVLSKEICEKLLKKETNIIDLLEIRKKIQNPEKSRPLCGIPNIQCIDLHNRSEKWCSVAKNFDNGDDRFFMKSPNQSQCI